MEYVFPSSNSWRCIQQHWELHNVSTGESDGISPEDCCRVPNGCRREFRVRYMLCTARITACLPYGRSPIALASRSQITRTFLSFPRPVDDASCQSSAKSARTPIYHLLSPTIFPPPHSPLVPHLPISPSPPLAWPRHLTNNRVSLWGRLPMAAKAFGARRSPSPILWGSLAVAAG